MVTGTDDDIGAMSYERALAELDGIIERLEKGAVDLDEAVSCYERGSRLVQRCTELLDRTEQTVTQLVVGQHGRDEERPFAVAGPAAEGDQAAGSGGGAARPPAEPVRSSAAPPRARPVAPPPPSAAGLFPGLAEGDAGASERPRRPAIDPDDIPF